MKKITRPRDGRMLTGVCAAIANYFNVDATLVRLGAVVLAICTLGTAVVAYAAAWLLIPDQQDEYAAWNA